MREHAAAAGWRRRCCHPVLSLPVLVCGLSVSLLSTGPLLAWLLLLQTCCIGYLAAAAVVHWEQVGVIGRQHPCQQPPHMLLLPPCLLLVLRLVVVM